MIQPIYSKAIGLVFLFLLLAAFAQPAPARAQDKEDIEKLKEHARALVDQTKFVEALPLLEKIVTAQPENAVMHFYLGLTLIAKANNTIDDQDRKLLRVRARNELIRSKELGNGEPLVRAMIGSLPPDGADDRPFSKNLGAHLAMVKAEGFFSQGKFDEALELYRQALSLDSNIYEAALFSGDVYLQRGNFAEAEAWYQKAIAIDPNRETAYRYSATPLMKQRKFDEARDRYVEAYITEPYSNFAISGITQWAKTTNTSLAHPQIEIPTNVKFDDKGDVNIDLDSSALLGGKDDGSFAWIVYGTTRSEWHKQKFAKQFPAESSYRHTLAEEVDAIRSVLSVAAVDKKKQKLSPTLAALQKLNDDGVLEAYILLAHPDDGIVRDHTAFLKSNRAILRRYVMKYVINGDGKIK